MTEKKNPSLVSMFSRNRMKSLAWDHDRRDLSAWGTAGQERSISFACRRKGEVWMDFPRATPTGPYGLTEVATPLGLSPVPVAH